MSCHRRHLRRSVATALTLVVTSLAPPLLAESDDPLSRLRSAVEGGAMRVRLDADLQLRRIVPLLENGARRAAELPLRMEISADGLARGPHLLRGDANVTMIDAPGSYTAQGGDRIEMRMLQVADGESMWMQLESERLDGTSVLTASLEYLERIGDPQGRSLGAPGGLSFSDPLRQILAYAARADLVPSGPGDGEALLEGQVPLEDLERLFDVRFDREGAKKSSLAEVRRVSIVLDPRTGYPERFTVGGESPFMTVQFREVERVPAETLGGDTFRYVPPEGVDVVDLTALAER